MPLPWKKEWEAYNGISLWAGAGGVQCYAWRGNKSTWFGDNMDCCFKGIDYCVSIFVSKTIFLNLISW